MRVRSGLLLAALVAALVFAGIALAADDPPTPAIAGEPRVGETLTATGATILKWQRCDPDTDPCAADASQNDSGWQNITTQESDPSTYTLTPADEGMMIRVLGKDTSEGTKFAPSNRVGPVGPVAPPPPGSIRVTKELEPSDDDGVFDLRVDDEVVADDVSDGGFGTESNLSPGTYTVSELAGTGISLGDYVSSIQCTGEGVAQSGTSLDVTVSAGENMACTITNTRLPVGPPLPPGPPLPLPPGPPLPPGEEPLRPSFQRTANLEPLEGIVLIKVPGSNQWVEIQEVTTVPMGTKVDVSNGHVLLVTQKKPSGGLQSIELWAGAFVLQQKRKRNITVLTLASSSAGAVQSRAGAETASLRKRKRRELWGRGKCRCRHRGRNSSGTSRGTWWLTAERRKGTLTKVKKGKVEVRDFKRRKKVLVKAGEKYLARR
jgi:Prealbumin-like fold domain